MGFFVPKFDLDGEKKPSAGQDYAPPEQNYKTFINLHGNHSNLEGMYDPRHHLPDSYLEPELSEVQKKTDRRDLLGNLAFALLCVLSIGLTINTTQVGFIIGLVFVATGLMTLHRRRNESKKMLDSER